MTNRLTLIFEAKSRIAHLFGRKCFVCHGPFPKKQPKNKKGRPKSDRFLLHHLFYKDGELTYKDNDPEYQLKITEIAAKNPKQFAFIHLGHHYVMEKFLKKMKPDNLARLVYLTILSRPDGEKVKRKLLELLR